MGRILCGHFRFKQIREGWLLCQDCLSGIKADSPTGKRLLLRKHGNELGLSPQQYEAHQQLVASYKELIEKAGTSDPEKLAEFANKGGEK